MRHFIHLSTHPFVHSFIHLPTHSFTYHSFLPSIIRPSIHSFIHPFIQQQRQELTASAKSAINVNNFMEAPVTDLQHLENTPDDIKTRMELLIMRIQHELCRALEAEDEEGKFRVEKWSRKEGGGGITCVLQDSQVFEKAGVNISVINGTLPQSAIVQMRTKFKEIAGSNSLTFFVAGISSVLHPRNPKVPTLHFNYRYFEVYDKNSGKTIWWFGGGTDLTPYILDEEDARNFHLTLKNACDQSDASYYQTFKKWCDQYFYIAYRGEARGVGGIFFDDLDGPDREHCFKFIKECAESVIPAYIPIVKKHKNEPYTHADRSWQLLRRGRYVEFNLVYDRGTKFGLVTPEARIESILMSLPLLAKWEYMHSPAPGSKEEKLLQVLKNPREWV
ncbi:hypothetical protein HELRODRAFT_86324 [Helobdella robusta]|uniref:coproporphyrinogen oxidase n=1 Tax=Helobdella robusta TaxID=6412 RepID=T1G6A4_HELRO|nr:hypothetical protein HELRODRAFT_86324 [Helobdella robusta]ESN95819.1 hypothetical protein HELRODRAFT_86324 [Helobdella robusta]